MMNAKEYLSQARDIDKVIDAKFEILEQAKAMATKVTQVMGAEPVSHSRNVSSMEDTIIRIIGMENDLNAEIDRWLDIKREIGKVIGQIDDYDTKCILEMYYLCGATMAEAAIKTGISRRQAYRVMEEGHQAVQRILDEEQKEQ